MRKSWRPASLALRVTAFVGIAISLCLTALGWTVMRSIEIHFAEQDADELNVVAMSVRRTLELYADNESELAQHLGAAVSGHHGVYYRVTNENNKLLFESHDVDLSRLAEDLTPVSAINKQTVTNWKTEQRFLRGAVLLFNIPTYNGEKAFTVIVASDMNFHSHFLSAFRKTIWLIIVAASVITIFAAWFAVHQGHAPLRKISNKIRNMDSEQLASRLDTQSVPAELTELVSSFNDMLDRIENVFQRLSNFSADIAHELRTPITNLITQTQVVLHQKRNVEKYEEILYSNLEEFERLSKVVNDMLLLAKSDNGILNLVCEPVHLKEEIEALFDFFGAWAEERELDLRLEGTCHTLHGSKTMLRRALSNLLTNAINHASAKSSVVVRLKNLDNNIVVEVENSGDDIPKENLDKIFQRFYRLDPSRKRSPSGEGAGLGLAIVDSIVRAHNGNISVNSLNGLTIFQISIPILPRNLK